MDVLTILPNFSTIPYTHIIPSLEKARITVVDLITLDNLEIAKRAHVPPTDVRRLAAHVVEALHHDVGFEETPNEAAASSRFGADTRLEPGRLTRLDLSRWEAIGTLDPAVDALLGGGIPCGYVTEVTGESGSGKTQFLLSLLLAVQLPRPRGLGKAAIYISTEAPLATNRLAQMLESHPDLSALPPASAPSLQNILSINAMDLEAQDHILNYQLPIAVSRFSIGLVVIDSITANFRAERASHDMLGLSARSSELARLGHLLRNLAAKENIAIVVANQVSDRFDASLQGRHGLPSLRGGAGPGAAPGSGAAQGLSSQQEQKLQHSHFPNFPSSSPALPSSPRAEDDQFNGSYLVANPARHELLSLVHQQRFFTGWGDEQSTVPALSNIHKQQQPPSYKTPALGFVWSTQIACRIALKRESRWTPSRPTSPMPKQNGSRNSHPADWRFSQHSRRGTGPGAASPPTAPATRDNTRNGESIQQARDESSRFQPAEAADHDHLGEDQNENKINNCDAQPRDNICTTFVFTDVAARRSTPTPSARQNAHPPLPESMAEVTRRTMKLVFAPWTAGRRTQSVSGGPQEQNRESRESLDDEVDFEIYEGGLRSIVRAVEKEGITQSVQSDSV